MYTRSARFRSGEMEFSSAVVVLSDIEKEYYKSVTENMHRLPVEGYEKLSKSIGVGQQVIEQCVKHYFYNESKNRSPQVIKILLASKY
ncbi:hypothetical protein Tco_0327249 [Tanacetum coccineum]